MGYTNLESLVDSILKLIPTKSVVKSVNDGESVESEPIAARKITIQFPSNPDNKDLLIIINGVQFNCLERVQYTFENISDLRNVFVSGLSASVIYYPAFSQFPNITPNNS